MFLEERISDSIDYGSGFGSKYANSISGTAGGDEYRWQRHPYIKATLQVDLKRQTNFVLAGIVDLNNRAGGKQRGFRVKHPIDHSTNDYTDPPSAVDQFLPLVNPVVAGVYQLTRWYGDSADLTCARRRIRKPVSGTVAVAVAGVAYPAAQWSVDYTTGVVTLAANKSQAITGITKASSAVLTVGTNTFSIGESVAVTGVAGMTQINGLRALVTAKPDSTHITVAINSALFSEYLSGGTVQTRPVTGEAVTAGCEFDLPMRFDADMRGNFSNYDTVNLGGVSLIEILNP